MGDAGFRETARVLGFTQEGRGQFARLSELTPLLGKGPLATEGGETLGESSGGALLQAVAAISLFSAEKLVTGPTGYARTAGDRHGFPLRFDLAWHLNAWCI